MDRVSERQRSRLPSGQGFELDEQQSALRQHPPAAPYPRQTRQRAFYCFWHGVSSLAVADLVSGLPL